MDPAAVLERFLDRPRVAYVREVLDTYGRAPGGLLANGLAFSALFAVIPIALVTLGVAGVLAGDPAVQEQLANAIVDVFPPLADLIEGALDALSSGAAAASLIGFVGLVWTVSQFYVTLDVAFSKIFSAQPERDVIRRTARGFAWVAVLIAVVIVMIIGVSLAVTIDAILPGQAPISSTIAGVAHSLVALVVVACTVVAVVYRIVPPTAPRWRSLAPPAIIVGLVVVGLSQLFVFLAPRLVGVAALAGSLATAFIALAWLSFTFQALLYGAAWVRVRDLHAGPRKGSALTGPAAPTEPGGGGQ